MGSPALAVSGCASIFIALFFPPSHLLLRFSIHAQIRTWMDRVYPRGGRSFPPTASTVGGIIERHDARYLSRCRCPPRHRRQSSSDAPPIRRIATRPRPGRASTSRSCFIRIASSCTASPNARRRGSRAARWPIGWRSYCRRWSG